MSDRRMFKARYDNGHGQFWLLFPSISAAMAIRNANTLSLQRGWELVELKSAHTKGEQK